MKYKRELEFEEDRYYSKILKIADSVFSEIIKPFLISKGWDYISGNGTYWIGEKDSEHSEDIDKLPKQIRDALQQEVGGYNQELGCFMPDFSYLEFQCNEEGK